MVKKFNYINNKKIKQKILLHYLKITIQLKQFNNFRILKH